MNGRAADESAVPVRLHGLVLAMAGRIDDSALGTCRELIARSRLDEAAELLAGTLLAGRVPVSVAEQRDLAQVLKQSRSDASLVEQFVVTDSGQSEPEHRFSADGDPADGVAEALDRVLRVLPAVRSVFAVWRTTAAGSVPGPLPQRVVLVEVGPEASPAVTAYRMQAALRQAGISAAVEVASSNEQWWRYHRQAYASAVPVWRSSERSGGDPTAQASGRSEAPQAGGYVQTAATAESSPAHGGVHGELNDPPAPATQEVSAAPVPPPPPVEQAPAAQQPDVQPPVAEQTPVAPTPVAQQTQVVRPVAPPQQAQQHAQTQASQPQPQPPQAAPAQAPERSADERHGVEVSSEIHPRWWEVESESAAQDSSQTDPDSEPTVVREPVQPPHAVDHATESAPDQQPETPDAASGDELSERDRLLLAQLHAELAKRERASSEKASTNGSSWVQEHRWADG